MGEGPPREGTGWSLVPSEGIFEAITGAGRLMHGPPGWPLGKTSNPTIFRRFAPAGGSWPQRPRIIALRRMLAVEGLRLQMGLTTHLDL